MTSPDENNKDIATKAQELKEMYLYGQLTIGEVIAASMTIGLDTAEQIFRQTIQAKNA